MSQLNEETSGNTTSLRGLEHNVNALTIPPVPNAVAHTHSKNALKHSILNAQTVEVNTVQPSEGALST